MYHPSLRAAEGWWAGGGVHHRETPRPYKTRTRPATRDYHILLTAGRAPHNLRLSSLVYVSRHSSAAAEKQAFTTLMGPLNERNGAADKGAPVLTSSSNTSLKNCIQSDNKEQDCSAPLGLIYVFMRSLIVNLISTKCKGKA